MRKYVVKKTYDNDGELNPHNMWKVLKLRSSSGALPRGSKHIFVEGVDTKYPIVFLNENDVFEIVEDPDAMVTGEALKELESSIKIKLERMEFGRRVIAIIFIIGDEKNLTKLQAKNFRQSFSTTRKQLHDGSIIAAEELINNIVPDNVLIKENDKIVLLNEIENNKSRLGYQETL